MINKEERRKVFERADHACEECGSMGMLGVHHVYYRSHMPKELMNDKWNLCVLCWRHHQGDEGVHSGNQKLRKKLERLADKRRKEFLKDNPEKKEIYKKYEEIYNFRKKQNG